MTFCRRVGCFRVLTGRQTKYCSAACRRAQWAQDTNYRVERPGNASERHHSARSRRGVNARSGLQVSYRRAVRELAAYLAGRGFVIETSADDIAELVLEQALSDRQRAKLELW